MDRYEVMAGKMTPLTDGAHRKWGFTGKVETRSYERLVDALIDFVETGDGLKARFLTGFAACLAADRKSVENRGFGVAVRKVQCHRGEDGTVRVSSVETMHERRYTVDDWRYDTAHCEQTETTGLHPNSSVAWSTKRMNGSRAMSPGGLMMVTAMSRMRPSHISAHWKEAARSGRSSLRRTSIWHGWNTRQTVIRRSTATWIR